LIRHASTILILCLLGSCTDPNIDTDIRINEIQILGSHNSYKQAIAPSLMTLIAQSDSGTARSLDYAHLPIDQQLDLGVRKFELDLYHDPEGGRYASPAGITRVAKADLPPGPPYDPEGRMRSPGFKVLHVQDIDFRSHHPTLEDCLQTMLAWSDRHPRHIPVYVMVECKSNPIDRPGFTIPLPFTKATLDSVDAEILRTIPRERIILPDEIRGNHETLEVAVRTGKAWPTLGEARGRFLFFLLTKDKRRALYLDGHPTLKGRVMFVTAPSGNPEAAILKFDNPVRDAEKIKSHVKQGYIVRTRSDSGTKQARSGDRTRFEAALLSGAQIISSDYYIDDPRFEPHYKVSFASGTVSRFTPLLQPDRSDHHVIE
jgi:hypothetical protein